MDYAEGGRYNIQDLAKRGIIEFAREHEDEDTARLLLSAARYPSIDMPAAVQQIEGVRTAREKWPSLLECEDFLYPPRLNREQSSSEATALHKACIYYLRQLQGEEVARPLRIADLTGGMGIDSFALAGWKAEEPMEVEVDYVEQDPELCELARSNAKALGLSNVHVHCGDSLKWLEKQDRRFDLIFVDPARRDKQGRKVAAFEDCTPDILAHQELLLSKGKEIMVKASPMIDISLAASQLRDISDIYVIAVQGECKEVLFLCGRVDGEPFIHCDHLHHGEVDTFAFTREDEARAQATYASEMGKYLYEPNAALMKAGPFKMLSQTERVDKLSRNTHLYTSDSLILRFPGRIFSVLVEIKPTRKEVQKRIPDGRAHVVTRNYPVAAAELQKQLGLKEGGDLFVIATTLGSRPCAFVAERIN
jgi:hypothetical protein